MHDKNAAEWSKYDDNKEIYLSLDGVYHVRALGFQDGKVRLVDAQGGERATICVRVGHGADGPNRVNSFSMSTPDRGRGAAACGEEDPVTLRLVKGGGQAGEIHHAA